MNKLYRVALPFLYTFVFLAISPHVQAFTGNVQIQATSEADGVLVKFKNNVSRSGRINSLSAAGVEETEKFRLVPGLTHAKIYSGQTLQQTMDALHKNPNVEYVEPNYIVTAQETLPDDPKFSSLYGLRNTGQTLGTPGADIHAAEAWDIETGTDVVIAVIDSGVDYNHIDLKDNIWTNPGEIPGNGIDDDGNGYIDDVHGWDFANDDNDPMDDHYHGTHVAGTIAAIGNNGIGVTGVNWHAKIMPLKFLGANGSGGIDAAIRAIEYAASMGARIASNSWGGPGKSQALQDAIANAEKMGLLFVAAAGNDSSDNDQQPKYPASYDLPNILSVAATDNKDQIASFSNYGATTVDVAAPGVDILSLSPNNEYRTLSGTSMATPHVSGVAGLLLAHDPGLTYAELKAAIMNTVDPVPDLQGITVTGGRVNVFKALSSLTGRLRITPNKAEIPLRSTLQFTADRGTQPYTWSVLDTNIGSIDSSTGLFQALSTGKTRLKVTDVNNDTGASGDIVVTQTTVNPDTRKLSIGQTLQFTAFGGTTPYIWESSNSGIASIDSNTGFLTTIAAGIVKVTATDDNGVSGTTGNIEVIDTKLNITPNKAVLGVGNKLQLSVSGGTLPYKWTSSNTSVAVVDGSGLLTGKGAGTTLITVLDAQGNQGLSDVIEVRSIIVTPTTGQIQTSQDLQFSVTGGVAPYIWKVSNSTVASIDANGLLKGLAGGTVTVTAIDADGAYGSSGTITVNGSGLPEIFPLGANLNVNERVQFTAIGGTPPYRWASGNPFIASIDQISGLLTANGAGKTFISVTDANGRSTSIFSITVRNVVVSPKSASIKIGENLQLTASGGLAPYTWRVDKPTIASIDTRTGMLTGRSVGTVLVKGIGVDGIYGTSEVQVVDTGTPAPPPPAPSQLKVNPQTAALNIGDTLKFTASGGTGIYNWSSSNTAAAIIDVQTGVLSARSIGSTIITVADSQGSSVSTGLIEVRDMRINPQSDSLVVGQTLQFSASGGVAPYIWSVNNPSVATINNTGLLTAFASGTVVVSASDVNGVVAHSGTITITNGNAAISILPYTAQLTVLQSLQFNVVGGRAPYFWSVTNPVAAKIVANTGLLTGLASGSTYVKALDSNGMTIISGVITIQGSSTQQLSLTPNSGLLIIGQTLQFTASGGKTPYTWSSLNPSIASINTSGLLTAASSGVTTVTVRDANGITATTGQIFVSTSSGPSLSILPETASVPRGGWLQFSVSGGVPPYFWRVSNPEVGAITLTSGFFQANYLKKGTTTVTATDANGNVAETGVIEVR